MKMTTFILLSSILGLLQCEGNTPNEPFEADYVLTEEKITYIRTRLAFRKTRN